MKTEEKKILADSILNRTTMPHSRINMQFRKTYAVFSIGTICLLLSVSMLAETEQRTIAVYGDSFNKPESAQKFHYMWNGKGDVGKAANYEKLSFNAKEKGYLKLGEDGKQFPGTPKGSDWMCLPGYDAKRDKKNIARYMIGALTLDKDSTGSIWIINGNLQHPYGEADKDAVDLKIFVNDTLKHENKTSASRVPTLFNVNLGKLKQNDTIYLAVGPGEASKADFFKLFCTIVDIPPNSQPSAPKNIIFPSTDTAHPKMTVSGDPKPSYSRTLKSHNKYLLKLKPDLVFLGDSITSGWDRDIMKERFGKYKAMQIGIGGDWIQNVLWRVQNSTLDKVKPKLIVLMIGTNNLSHGYGADAIATGNSAILDAIKKKTPSSKVLLLGVFPRGKKITEAKNVILKKVNSKLANMADNQRVFFLDIGDKLIESDGSISRTIFRDGIHPTKAGYIRWADAIQPTVEKLMSD